MSVWSTIRRKLKEPVPESSPNGLKLTPGDVRKLAALYQSLKEDNIVVDLAGAASQLGLPSAEQAKYLYHGIRSKLKTTTAYTFGPEVVKRPRPEGVNEQSRARKRLRLESDRSDQGEAVRALLGPSQAQHPQASAATNIDASPPVSLSVNRKAGPLSTTRKRGLPNSAFLAACFMSAKEPVKLDWGKLSEITGMSKGGAQ